MFQFIQKHQKLIQVLMTLMIVPFAFSGVSGVINDNSSGVGVVAKVGSQEITQRMFEAEYQAYTEQMRRSLGEKFDAALFDGFDKRKEFLDEMINEAVLKEAAQKEHLSVADESLAQALRNSNLVPKDAQGNIDFATYEKLAHQRGLTTKQYEEQIRSMLSSEVIAQASALGNVALPLQQNYLQKFFAKSQLIEQKNIGATSILATIKVSDNEVQKYYQEHAAEFTRDGMFDLEYAVIPVISAGYVPSDEDIQAAFGAATADDIASVRKDSAKLRAVVQKVAESKMESVAKSVIEAATANPKDIKAIVAKFGGVIETARGVTRKGSADLPAALKVTEIREVLTGSDLAASNDLSTPLPYAGNLLVGRVVKSTASGLQPLDAVRAEIEANLKHKQALAKLREEADKQITLMKSNPSASIGTPTTVNMLQKTNIATAALTQIMAVKTYPSFVVNEGERDVSVIRVVSAAADVVIPPEALRPLVDMWQATSVQLQQQAFLQTLRERYGVKMYLENLGGRNNPVVN